MHHRHIIIIALAIVFAGSAVIQLTANAEGIATNRCCFTNPRFTGVCKVTPGPDESCNDILAYLNNQNSVGKSYCGNTTIRGGWRKAACESNSTVTSCEQGEKTKRQSSLEQ